MVGPVKLAINAILVKNITGIILPTWYWYLVPGTYQLMCKTELMLPGTYDTHTW